MSIYEAIGGKAAVTAAVEEFYRRVLADPELKPYFEGLDVDRLKAHQRGFIAVALGGPESYKGRSMGEAHAGMGITPAHFGRVVEHLEDTLVSLGVQDDTVKTIAESLAPLQAEIAPGA
jgi:hemoglobin